MQHVKTKDVIMGRVKSALGSAPGVSLPVPDFDSPILTPFTDDVEMTFVQNFKAVKGQFFFCIDEADCAKQIATYVQKKDLKDVFIWEKSFESIFSNVDFYFKVNEDDYINCELGITSCEALIARTGSILISSATLSGRRNSVFPPIHAVIARTSQIVSEIKEGLNLVKEKYADNYPSLVSLITGPSRTADIEKTLVLGAHGPKELLLFLIDDSQY